MNKFEAEIVARVLTRPLMENYAEKISTDLGHNYPHTGVVLRHMRTCGMLKYHKAKIRVFYEVLNTDVINEALTVLGPKDKWAKRIESWVRAQKGKQPKAELAG